LGVIVAGAAAAFVLDRNRRAAIHVVSTRAVPGKLVRPRLSAGGSGAAPALGSGRGLPRVWPVPRLPWGFAASASTKGGVDENCALAGGLYDTLVTIRVPGLKSYVTLPHRVGDLPEPLKDFYWGIGQGDVIVLDPAGELSKDGVVLPASTAVRVMDPRAHCEAVQSARYVLGGHRLGVWRLLTGLLGVPS